MGLDGDAALALQVHGVQHLLHHFALRKRAGDLQQAVRQRRLAVVDVRNDREIADEFAIHAMWGCSVERLSHRADRQAQPHPSGDPHWPPFGVPCVGLGLGRSVMISIVTGALPAPGTRTVRRDPSAVVIILTSNLVLSKPPLAMVRSPSKVTIVPPFVTMKGPS